MKITFLGVGSAINTDSIGSSILVDSRILLDAPPGIPQALRARGVDPTTLHAVVVTHAHGDHCFGLPFLLLECMVAPRSEPLTILGPANLHEIMVTLTRTAFPEADPERLMASAQPRYFVARDGEATTMANLSVRAHRVPHGQTETYAISIRSTPGGGTLLYAPDIEESPSWLSLIEEANLVLLDATTREDPISSHLSLAQVKVLAARHPTKTFAAIHRSIYACDPHELPGNLLVPNAGDSLWID